MEASPKTPSLLDALSTGSGDNQWRAAETDEPLAEAHTSALAPDLTLVVAGDPVPWTPTKRNPQTGNRFLPGRQEEALGRARDAWLRLERAGEVQPFEAGVPLEMSVEFYVKRPKTHFGTGRNERILKPWAQLARPTKRPDFSNLCKLIEDALTSLAWRDDDQIVGYREPAGKFFCAPGEMPRTVLRIWRLIA